MKFWILNLLAVAGLIGPSMLVAEAPRPESAESQITRIAELIRQLGDPQFSVRQQASRQLEEIGPPAKDLLTGALTHPDAEIRYRAQRALLHVLQIDFVTRLEAFALDTDNNKSYGLPCWTLFKKLAGDSSAARQLFAEAVRAEPALLQTVDQEPRLASDALMRRCDVLIGAASRSRHGRFNTSETPRVAVPRMMALLLSACSPESATNDGIGMRVSQLFHQSKLAEELKGYAPDHPARQLLGAWIERCADSNLAFQSIWLGMRYDLPQALAPARLLLKRAEQQPYVRQMAILAIGRFGSRAELAELEPLLTDKASCNSNTEEKTSYRCEIRDVALASIIHLHGRDPKEFGFEKIQKNPETLFNQSTMGFDDAARRSATHARWKAWLSQQPTPAARPSQQGVTQAPTASSVP